MRLMKSYTWILCGTECNMVDGPQATWTPAKVSINNAVHPVAWK